MNTDEHQEYEDGWRKDVLKDFKRGLNSTIDDTVTIVWEDVPFHLSSGWVISVFEEITDKFNYRPIEWTQDANITYVTFENVDKPCGGQMEMLQRACYPESG